MKFIFTALIFTMSFSQLSFAKNAVEVPVCPAPAVHFCRCEKPNVDTSSVIRVDIQSGQKIETILTTVEDTSTDCNFLINRLAACK